MSNNFYQGVLGIAVVGLILIMLVPLPPFVLDILLSFSLILSVTTLLATLYVRSVLDFSSFPSLLLFLTFFRLGLNIASTRMILTKACAGHIIGSFGTFVTQESVLVGFILFILLTLINFVVVTKGAGRIAEVAARFVLEAMPGKQLAVDSAVNTHSLNYDEAKKARFKITSEAEFYGAMDGASKFVRGEAIASLFITGINILGGFATAIFMKKGTLTLYTNLIIGDGLVTQIPALLVSVGAGILVTRVSIEDLGKTLPEQIFGNCKVVFITGLLILALTFIPGMPIFVMLPMSLLLFFSSWALFKRKTGQTYESQEFPSSIAIHLGEQKTMWRGSIEKKIEQMLFEIQGKLGIILPKVLISKDDSLPAEGYKIQIKGSTFFSSKGDDLEGLLVHLKEGILQNAYRLINRQDVARMIENAKAYNAAVVEELLSKKLNLGHILKVLQNLLKEGVPIIDFISILEVLADHTSPQSAPDPDLLTEQVRIYLSKAIVEHYFGHAKMLYTITFDPEVEEMIAVSSCNGLNGKNLLLRPKTIANIERHILALLEKAKKQGIKPVIVTSVKSRLPLSHLLEKHLPALPILSYKEIGEEIKVHSLGTVANDSLIP